MIRTMLALIVVAVIVFLTASHRPHHTGNVLPSIAERGVWFYGVAPGNGAAMAGEDGAFRCDIPKSDGIDWHAMCYYNRLHLVSGQQYRVRFEAKASQNCVISLEAREEWTGERNVGLHQQVPLVPQWVNYDYTFTAATVADHKVRAPMFLMGNASGTIWIKNVTLEEI